MVRENNCLIIKTFFHLNSRSRRLFSVRIVFHFTVLYNNIVQWCPIKIVLYFIIALYIYTRWIIAIVWSIIFVIISIALKVQFLTIEMCALYMTHTNMFFNFHTLLEESLSDFISSVLSSLMTTLVIFSRDLTFSQCCTYRCKWTRLRQCRLNCCSISSWGGKLNLQSSQ